MYLTKAIYERHEQGMRINKLSNNQFQIKYDNLDNLDNLDNNNNNNNCNKIYTIDKDVLVHALDNSIVIASFTSLVNGIINRINNELLLQADVNHALSSLCCGQSFYGSVCSTAHIIDMLENIISNKPNLNTFYNTLNAYDREIFCRIHWFLNKNKNYLIRKQDIIDCINNDRTIIM